MASYVAFYGKKRSRLVGHERTFIAALNAGVSGSALSAAVETIRSAQIRALKEKRAKFAPSEQNFLVLKTIDADMNWWHQAPELAIIDGYQQPKNRRSMSSAVRKATG